MDDKTLVHEFCEGRFDARIFLTRATDETFSGHVDIFDGEVCKCRIVLAGPLDQSGAIAALGVRARDWISGWNNRDHSGDTGLVEL